MSNSPQTDSPDNGPRPGLPTAMIHKKILDAARDDPSASFTELSKDVTGASVKLVERVLENYGDPAERLIDETVQRPSADETTPSDPLSDDVEAESSETRETTNSPSNGTVSTGASEPPAVTELPETQLETLAAIAEHPSATQRELADVLGVSCATVNRRVSAVEGLAWAERQSFVESLFGTVDDGRERKLKRATGDLIDDRIETPEPQHDDCGASATLDNPELVQKVLHACLESDRITDDEELEIIGAFV